MDIFRFPPYSSSLDLKGALLVEDIKSKTWIERYRDNGEFTFEMDLASPFSTSLWVGALVSHVRTPEVMIVENREISTDQDGVDIVKFTGRSFETFYEQRMIGASRDWTNPTYPMPDITLPRDVPARQARNLINSHTSPLWVYDQSDAIANVYTQCSNQLINQPTTLDDVERVVKRGDLYKEVVEMLAIDDLGIRTFRPGTKSPLGAWTQYLVIEIYDGNDLRSSVNFSHDLGDISTADYLESNKLDKNAALVVGRWVDIPVTLGATGADKRWMIVDASDLDQQYQEVPAGADLERLKGLFRSRGLQSLSTHNGIDLLNVTPSIDSSTRFVYRDDYEVGDIVTVDGEYGESATRRIIEYVEIEDENGESGYPTFSKI